jgi:DNA-binding transcriptional LysR family regulator
MEDVVDITSLRLVVAVCDRQHGRRRNGLKLQTPAVSKRIARLETALRTKLFVRRSDGLKSTPAGAALLPHARSLALSVERMIDDVCALGAGRKGIVTICATISAISESLTDDVLGFMSQEAFKNIRVTVEEETSEHLLRRLHEGSASFGICWDHIDTEGLATSPYIRDTLCAIVPTSHPLAARSRTSFANTRFRLYRRASLDLASSSIVACGGSVGSPVSLLGAFDIFCDRIFSHYGSGRSPHRVMASKDEARSALSIHIRSPVRHVHDRRLLKPAIAVASLPVAILE